MPTVNAEGVNILTAHLFMSDSGKGSTDEEVPGGEEIQPDLFSSSCRKLLNLPLWSPTVSAVFFTPAALS